MNSYSNKLAQRPASFRGKACKEPPWCPCICLQRSTLHRTVSMCKREVKCPAS